MDLRLRRAMGMLKVGRAADAAEAAEEAGREAGQPPLAAVSIAARVAAAGAKSLCERAAEGEALDELTALKVLIIYSAPHLVDAECWYCCGAVFMVLCFIVNVTSIRHFCSCMREYGRGKDGPKTAQNMQSA